MVGSKSYERELGAVTVQIENLETGQEQIRNDFKQHRDETEKHRGLVREDLDEIKATLRDIKTAWKTTAIISSIVSGVVATLITLGKILIPFLPR
jgi:multidrug resistance efflux pump